DRFRLIVRMANPHDPGPPHAISDDPSVAPGRNYSTLYPARLQESAAPIHGVAFWDTAQIAAHAGLRERHAVRLLFEDEVPVVHPRQRLFDLLIARFDVLAIVVEVPDARVGDVERAVGYLREMQGQLDEVEELLVDDYSLFGAPRIDLRQLAFRLVVAHQ